MSSVDLFLMSLDTFFLNNTLILVREIDIENLKLRELVRDDEAKQPHEVSLTWLNADVPHWRQLTRTIGEDLAVASPYGIRWWRTHDTARRILISDYLYSCASSVIKNLIEATLHLLEFQDFSERISKRLKCAASPIASNRLEALELSFASLHSAGFVRAIASTIDCLASVLIGILPMEKFILLAQFKDVRNELLKLDPCKDDSLSGFRMRFKSAIDESGVSGWLDWVMDFRNMLVHRGRRLEVDFPESKDSQTQILHPWSGAPIQDYRSHVPAAPGLSEIQAWLRALRNNPGKREALSECWLTESAETTFDGVLESTRKLVDAIGKELLEVWAQRKSDENRQSQPVHEQWPCDVWPSNHNDFAGYRSSSPQTITRLGMSPIDFRRLRAAALDTSASHQWGDWLPASRPNSSSAQS